MKSILIRAGAEELLCIFTQQSYQIRAFEDPDIVQVMGRNRDRVSLRVIVENRLTRGSARRDMRSATAFSLTVIIARR